MEKGFLYILRNEAMPGLLKIGYSVKVPTERVAELFTTGVPEPFELVYYCLVENADKVETQVHRDLNTKRHRGGREFFRIDLDEAIQSITRLCQPEHEWPGIRQQSVAPPHEILIESRKDDPIELAEMAHFVEEAEKRSLAFYVQSLFYDSNACMCYFKLNDCVDEDDIIGQEIYELAIETIGQFDWFGKVCHGIHQQDQDQLPL
jgi:T5orf172 domain